MARDNTDEIPIDRIDGWPPPRLDQAPRKDKLRGVEHLGSDRYRAHYEAVPGWKPRTLPGTFGQLWLFRRDGARWRMDRSPAAQLERGVNDTAVNFAATFTPGEDVGYLIHAASQNVRSAIRTFTAAGEDPPPPISEGRVWPYKRDGRSLAPVCVMAPTLQFVAELGAWLQDIYPAWLRAGIDGLHIAMMSMYDTALERIIELNFQHQRVTWCWLMQENRGTPAEALVLLDLLLDHLATHPHALVLIGPTYDVFQSAGWQREDDVNAWLREARRRVAARALSDSVLVFARARPQDDYRDGDARCWEDHIDEPEDIEPVLRAMIARDPEHLVATSERWRKKLGGAGKQFTWPQLLTAVRLARELQVATVVGCEGLDNVSDHGSVAPDDEAAFAAAVGASAEPDTGDGAMLVIIPPEYMRHYMCKLGGPSGGEDKTTGGSSRKRWLPEADTAETDALRADGQNWIITDVHQFHGNAADDGDEATGTAYLIDATGNRREIPTRVIHEKDHPSSGFNSSNPWSMGAFPREWRAELLLRFHGSHTNTGSQPHIELHVYAFDARLLDVLVRRGPFWLVP